MLYTYCKLCKSLNQQVLAVQASKGRQENSVLLDLRDHLDLRVKEAKGARPDQMAITEKMVDQVCVPYKN